MLLSIDWTAGATFILAGIAVLALIATAVQAKSSTDMIAEVKLDRELAITPYLHFRFDASFPHGLNGMPLGSTVYLKNIGRGPALNCLYCARFQREAQAAQNGVGVDVLLFRFPLAEPSPAPLHLAPQDDRTTGTLSGQGNFEPDAEVVLTGLQSKVGLLQVAVCEDEFGNRYRFRSDQPWPDVWRLGQKTQGWETWIPLRPSQQ